MEIPIKSGLIQDEVDSRDILLGSVVGDIPLPSKYDVLEGITKIKIEDQNGSSSCVAQAGSKYAEVLNFKETSEWMDLSAKFAYSRIHFDIGGARLRDFCKLLTDTGICPEYLDPSYPSDENRMRIVDNDPMVLDSAKVYKCKSYVGVPTNLDLFKRAIYAGNGLFTGSNVSQGGWGFDAVRNSGGYVRPPITGETWDGHAIYIHAYDDELQRFSFINSWSASWGINGKGYFRYSDVGWLFYGWTIVDAPNNLINQAKDMYNLIRDPNKPSEVYALTGQVIRHIANLQTLKLGDTEPDRYWVWEGKDIPVALKIDWDKYALADEIHLDPKD